VRPIQTVVSPGHEFASAWALERPASEPLRVHVVPSLPVETRGPPGESELILWYGAPGADGGPDFFACLNQDEQRRAASFRFEADRWAFAAAHAGLRAILASMLQSTPQALHFVAGANGKPYLDPTGSDTRVCFNISHTRGCVAVAIAGCAVGVDVERRRPIPDLMAVARMAFAQESCDAIVSRSEPVARTALFYRYWTLGEAFIKATGEGIAQNLTSFAFTEEGAPALTRVTAGWGPPGRWRFCCKP
jgi:4'-phosphopantetheinyl transferase